jgi:hypothetical protein
MNRRFFLPCNFVFSQHCKEVGDLTLVGVAEKKAFFSNSTVSITQLLWRHADAAYL